MRTATQIAIRLPQRLVDELDSLVPDRYPTRADAVRDALEQLLVAVRREDLERRYAEGYRRRPMSDAELRWIDVASSELLLEESW